MAASNHPNKTPNAATIGFAWERVDPLSGNNYRFKIKVSNEAHGNNLYLNLNGNEYKTSIYYTYGDYYFDYSCYCWRRRAYYQYNYIDRALDNVNGDYTYHYRWSANNDITTTFHLAFSTVSLSITCRREATAIGDYNAEATATETATVLEQLLAYDIETMPLGEIGEERSDGTIENIYVNAEETRSRTAESSVYVACQRTATGIGQASATGWANSTISKSDATNKAHDAAEAIAWPLAESRAFEAALANAQLAADTAAQEMAEEEADESAHFQALALATSAATTAAQSEAESASGSGYVEDINDDESLLLVHGFCGSGNAFEPLRYFNPIRQYYGLNDIIAIDYYNTHAGYEPEFSDITVWSSITTIGDCLKNYIIRAHNDGILKSNLDIVAHSMGGLVVRSMIKRHYREIKDAGITINHVATMGTPNHGLASISLIAWLSGLGWLDILPMQGTQMSKTSSFLAILNLYDETPYSVFDLYTPDGTGTLIGDYDDIIWSTFANGDVWWIFDFSTDGTVDTDSIGLAGNDVTNYGIYDDVGGAHNSYYTNEEIMEDLYYELLKPKFMRSDMPLSYSWLDKSPSQVSGNTYRFRIRVPSEYRYAAYLSLNGEAYPLVIMEHQEGWKFENYVWMPNMVYDYNYIDINLIPGRDYAFFYLAQYCGVKGYVYESSPIYGEVI
ncbi:MAG: esterase/lipase family protein [Promethearchaeota archaeon]